MNQVQKEWYLDAVAHELDQITPDFVGNVDFKCNIKENSIMNMNIVLSKSIKMPTPVYRTTSALT